MTPRRGSGVLFITYNGLLDPLGHSQVLPYLERLHQQWPVHILSFEHPERLAVPGALAEMRARVDAKGLAWTWLRYHKRPSLPATTYDVAHGILSARRILAAHPIGLIHCRGYVPTTIGLRAAGERPVLFDIRGLQPEEYVDGGLWKKGELKWRLAKRSERRFFQRAAGGVVLTRNILPYAEGRFREAGRSVPIEVIPCCTDLEKFRFDATARTRLRVELGVGEETVLFVYSGSIGTWYMPEEMARFVRVFRDTTGRSARLLWLINNGESDALAAGRRAGLGDPEQLTMSVPAGQVASYLCAADAALALVRPCFSKRSSSPTKYAECLAVGLPLVLSRAVGDSAVVAARRGAVGLDAFTEEELRQASIDLCGLLELPREHFRQVAVELFDVNTVGVPAYQRLYRALLR